MVLEWDVLFQLFTSVGPAGTSPGLPPLDFNTPVSVGTTPLGAFMLDPSKCQSGAARRITRNNLAQADGEITHRKFKSGYVFELNVQFWENVAADPACAGTLRQMGDILGEYLEAIANADGQLVWQPSQWPPPPSAIATSVGEAGYPNPRLLDQCRSMGPSGQDSSGSNFVSIVTEKDANAKLYDVTFALLSPFPYVTDFMNYPTSPDAEVVFATCIPVLGDGPCADSSVTIFNDGTVPYFPRFHIYGPTSEFTLTNTSVLDEAGNPMQIVWTPNGSGPVVDGGWMEIDCFRNTAYLNDGFGFLTNGKGGIAATGTDFFPLVPGPNVITIDKELVFDQTNYAGDQVICFYRNAWE